MDELSRWMKYRLARKHVLIWKTSTHSNIYVLWIQDAGGSLWFSHFCVHRVDENIQCVDETASCNCFCHFRFKFLTGITGWMKTFHFSSTCYEYSSTLPRHPSPKFIHRQPIMYVVDWMNISIGSPKDARCFVLSLIPHTSSKLQKFIHDSASTWTGSRDWLHFSVFKGWMNSTFWKLSRRM